MNQFHTELLEEIQKYKRQEIDQSLFQRYHGTPRFCYGVRVPDKRKIAAAFLKQHQDISSQQFVGLLTSLYQGKSYDERSLAGYLLELSQSYRAAVPLEQLEKWLDKLVGWAEIDTTCQSSFSAVEVLAEWENWKDLLSKLSTSTNINQRRASLVLLVKPVRETSDEQLLDFALQQIEKLKTEKDILITKAISWLLRSTVTHHATAIEHYLKEQETSLPRIALRETRIKLATGKKNYGKKR